MDPASIFDGAEALLELTRRGKDAPQRAAAMSDEDYRLLCVKVTNTLLTLTGLHLVMVAPHGNWKADFICLVFHHIAQRCGSKTEKFILENLFSSILSRIKKISPLLKLEI